MASSLPPRCGKISSSLSRPSAAGYVPFPAKNSKKGKPKTLRSPHQASVLGIGFCTEDRKTDGIIAAASVRENIILALQAQRGWLRPISRKEQQEIAERFIRQLGIRTPSTEQPIEFLSGGNQQKVLLSRWLLTRPQFLSSCAIANRWRRSRWQSFPFRRS